MTAFGTGAFLLAQGPSVGAGSGSGDTAIEDIVPAGITAADWIQAGVLVAVAIVLGVLVSRLVVRLVLAGTSSRRGVARLLGRLAGLVVFVAGLLYALNPLGVRIAPLLGALGIVGIALAFALQDILENFIAGVILQIRDPFRLGDQVVSDEWEGVVEDVNFRAVVLHTFDGTRVVLPSSMVLKAPIQNLTAFEQRRTTVEVGVAYGTDLRQAVDIIARATADADGVAAEPAPQVYLKELGESSVDFAVRYWHEPTVAGMWLARHAVLVATYEALDAAGIEIPFPQRTLSFREPVPIGGEPRDREADASASSGSADRSDRSDPAGNGRRSGAD